VEQLENRMLLSISGSSLLGVGPARDVTGDQIVVHIAPDSAPVVEKSQLVQFDVATHTEKVYSVEASAAMLHSLGIDVEGMSDALSEHTLPSAGTGLPSVSPADGSPTVEPTFIFSPDDRSHVARSSVTTYPYSPNGRMWMTFPGDPNEFSGSGVMVNRSFFLTAGHCVWDSTWASEITFSPGQDGDAIGGSYQRSEYQPFGQAVGAQYWSFTGWTDFGDWNYDMAWVQLDRNMGDYTGWYGYGWNSDDAYYNNTATTSGYPGDLTPTQYDMWTQAGNARTYGITADQLQTNTMDVYPGQSGSGVYYDGQIVHAVISSQWSSGGTPLYNMFTRMTSEKFDTIKGVIDSATTPTDYPDLVDYDQWFNTNFAWLSSAVVSTGDSLSVGSVVRNNGTATAGPFSVRFRLSTDTDYDVSDYFLADTTVSSLAALDWGYAAGTGTVPSVPIGNYYLVWSIDPFGDVTEFAENNNTGFLSSRQVKVGSRPTLTSFSGPVDSTLEDTQAEVTFADLAAKGNEADADGTVTAFVVTSVTSGTLLIGQTPGSATPWTPGTNDAIDAAHNAYWTPPQDANGLLDAVAVVARDNDLLPSTPPVTAQVLVSEVNDAPIAVDDNLTTREDTPLVIPVSVLLANDRPGPANESGQTLTMVSVAATPDTHGTVQLIGGNVVYTPAPDYNYFDGSASFRYIIRDNGTTNGVADPLEATGIVHVRVSEVNDRPVPQIDYPITAEDTPMHINADLLAWNDTAGPTNEAGQHLTVIDVRAVWDTHGTLMVTRDPLNPDRIIDIIYTPAPDYHGPARFQYLVRDDGTTDGAAAPIAVWGWVHVTVTEVNDPPVPGADAKTTQEDTELVFPASDLLTNDIAGPVDEQAWQTLTVTAVRPTADTHGMVWLEDVAGVKFVHYRPDHDYNTVEAHSAGLSWPASFEYQVTDDGVTDEWPDPQSTWGTVIVTVTEVNDAPVANPDTGFTTQEDHYVDIPVSDLLRNDNAGDGMFELWQTIRVIEVRQTADTHGTVELIGDVVRYTPDHDYNTREAHFAGLTWPAVFEYRVKDNGTTNGAADPLLSNWTTVAVVVTEVNDPPVANPDSYVDHPDIYTTQEDTELHIPISVLLANDNAGDGVFEIWQTIHLAGVRVTPDTHGTVRIAGNEVIYTPDANYNTVVREAELAGQSYPAVFQYQITDDGTTDGAFDPKLSDWATVTLAVTEVNDAPVAVDDNLETLLPPIRGTEDTQLVIPVSVLLANDTAGDGAFESWQTLRIVDVWPTPDTHGIVQLVGDNVIYTPDLDYNTPEALFAALTAPVRFKYLVADNGTTNGLADPKTSNWGYVSLTVTEVNDPPVVANDDLETLTPPIRGTEDTYVDIPVSVLLANDSRGDGAFESWQTIHVADVRATADTHGTVQLIGNVVRYTPNPDYNTAEAHFVPLSYPVKFEYRIADDGTTNGVANPLPSNWASVSLKVTEVNDAPVAVDDDLETLSPKIRGTEDQPLQFLASVLVANDTRGDGAFESWQTLRVVGVRPTADTHGTVQLDGDYIVFTPDPDYNTAEAQYAGLTFPVRFEYQMADNGTTNGVTDSRTSNWASVRLTVTEVNDAPIARDDTGFVTREDTALTIDGDDLLTNDSNGDGLFESWQHLRIYDVRPTADTHGTLQLLGGNVIYTPDPNYNNGAPPFAIFQYRAIDDGTTNGIANPLPSNWANVFISVTAVNDAPVPFDDSTRMQEGGVLSFNASLLAANDSPGPADEWSQTLTVMRIVADANAHGTAVLSEDPVTHFKTIVYTPDPHYHGPAMFYYVVADSGAQDSPDRVENGIPLHSNEGLGRVYITVGEVNDAPIPVDDMLYTTKGVAISVLPAQLTSNDSRGPYEDEQSLTVIQVFGGSATHGLVAIVGGNVVYTPNANFTGMADFWYVVQDNGTTNGFLDPKQATGVVHVNVIDPSTHSTHLWTGASTANSKWSTPENWAGNVAPTAGDNLVFPAGASRLENYHDIASSTVFGSIVIAGSGYRLHDANALQSRGSFEIADQASVTVESITADSLCIGGNAAIGGRPSNGAIAKTAVSAAKSPDASSPAATVVLTPTVSPSTPSAAPATQEAAVVSEAKAMSVVEAAPISPVAVESTSVLVATPAISIAAETEVPVVVAEELAKIDAAPFVPSLVRSQPAAVVTTGGAQVVLAEFNSTPRAASIPSAATSVAVRDALFQGAAFDARRNAEPWGNELQVARQKVKNLVDAVFQEDADLFAWEVE
jgi:V8-like Glu-specific endopeptidase